MRTFLIFVCLLPHVAFTQVTPTQTRLAVQDLQAFIGQPNFGLNKNDIAKNIAWLETEFNKRGFATQILETTGNPLFFAKMKIDPAVPTILFYMHLDGQAVDPTKWDQKDPYQAIVKKLDEQGNWVAVPEKDLQNLDPDWRVFGRSTSDDKGPIIAFLHSIDHLKAKGATPAFNVKVILDAEEELGSKPLTEAVKMHKEVLSADALIINDGPVHISGKPTLVFGCRGITTVNFTIYGPVRPQHSGHYGNYAPNPIFRMANLLSTMKDEEGRVLVDGYYDGINLDADTKSILAKVPDDPQVIHELLEINTPEKVGENYQEALQYPSLNARGINAGWVGVNARTIVPDLATVAIDIRLVPESDPDKLVAAIKSHIEKQGYYLVDHEPTKEERLAHAKILFFHQSKATLPFRTDMDAPIGLWLENVIQEAFAEAPVKVRIMGGTVPIAAFINELNIPAVIVPMVNPDNNQHSPNENIRIGHLKYAMQLFSAILETAPMSN